MRSDGLEVERLVAYLVPAPLPAPATPLPAAFTMPPAKLPMPADAAFVVRVSQDWFWGAMAGYFFG